MAQLMIDNPSSIFLVSGQSRSNPEIGNLHKEEIIQLEKLEPIAKEELLRQPFAEQRYLEALRTKEERLALPIARLTPSKWKSINPAYLG